MTKNDILEEFDRKFTLPDERIYFHGQNFIVFQEIIKLWLSQKLDEYAVSVIKEVLPGEKRIAPLEENVSDFYNGAALGHNGCLKEIKENLERKGLNI